MLEVGEGEGGGSDVREGEEGVGESESVGEGEGGVCVLSWSQQDSTTIHAFYM